MRTDYIHWDEYFILNSLISGLRSKDPSTQVGACIVKNNKVIGMGYNGLPNGCKDEDYPWDCKEGKLEDTKYPYVCHAELNAILNCIERPEDATIYVSLFPCNECAKAIIQSGIKEVVYLSDKYDGTPENNISKRLLKDAGVNTRQLSLTKDRLDEILTNVHEVYDDLAISKSAITDSKVLTNYHGIIFNRNKDTNNRLFLEDLSLDSSLLINWDKLKYSINKKGLTNAILPSGRIVNYFGKFLYLTNDCLSEYDILLNGRPIFIEEVLKRKPLFINTISYGNFCYCLVPNMVYPIKCLLDKFLKTGYLGKLISSVIFVVDTDSEDDILKIKSELNTKYPNMENFLQIIPNTTNYTDMILSQKDLEPKGYLLIWDTTGNDDIDNIVNIDFKKFDREYFYKNTITE